MTNFTVPEQANNILASGRRSNRPHPDDPTKRIIGWVVDEDEVGMGEGLLALEEIERRAKGVIPVPRYENTPAPHTYVPHPKWRWFCRDCGYGEHEKLKHK